mgnify:CR=1 FL=1
MFGRKKKKVTMEKLKKFNQIMAVMHGLQALVIILISSDFKLPVNTSYLSFNEETEKLVSQTTKVFDMPFAWLVISFLILLKAHSTSSLLHSISSLT